MLKQYYRYPLVLIGTLGLAFAAVASVEQSAKVPETVAANGKKYIFVVFTRPVPGKESEYNDWYNGAHLADVVKIPGFKSAQRFKLVSQGNKGFTLQYLAIYDIETNNISQTKQALKDASGDGSIQVSAALDRGATQSAYFEPIGPMVRSQNHR